MSYRKAKLLLEQKKASQQTLSQTKQTKQQQQKQISHPLKKSNNIFQAFQNSDDQDQQQALQEKQIEIKDKINSNQTNKEKQQKKKKPKNKNKKKKKQIIQEKQEDIEKIFKQVGLQYKVNAKQDVKENEDWYHILQINQTKFNYQKQLRRHFGNTTNLNEQKADDPEMDRRQQKLQKHLRKTMKKSVLSPGVKDFFMIRQKFEVEREEGKVKFIPTKKYDHYQIEYESIRNSNDINALFMFMQTHPEHVDSIYAVGEFLRLQGNYRDADSLIQRVIYIYEMAASFDLNQFIKEDLVKKQIVYDKYSISLFMSLFKFMDILGKKGCYRAALEYNKFLLKINPNDPTACILCIDFNSISAKSYDYLLKFIEGYSRYIGDEKSSLYLLPNFIFSAALAKYYLDSSNKQSDLVVEEKHNLNLLKFDDQDWKNALHLPTNNSFINESAKVLILRAILTYPKLIVQIANKNEYSKQFLNYNGFQNFQKKSFKDILIHQFWANAPISYSYNFLRLETVADSAGFDKVLQVYVERSKILWKSNEVMLWVKGAMGFVLNQIEANKFNYQEHLQKLCIEEGGGMPISFPLSRYANISKANFSDRVQRIDLANIQDNQQFRQAPQNENRMNLQGNPISMFLNSLLPWVNLPNSERNEDPDMPDIHEDD